MKIFNEGNESSRVEIFPVKITNILKAKVPDDAIFDINAYLDQLVLDKNKKSNAKRLAGEISLGEQLHLDPESKSLKELSGFITNLCEIYCNKFFSDYNGVSISKNFSMSSMWSIHQYSGDYNPLHSHSTESLEGLSCFLYLKIPSQISRVKDGAASYTGGGGLFDGNTQLVFGHSSLEPDRCFKFPGHMSITPAVGMLYLFPKWVPHMVYPFSGDGERRSLSANINVF